MSLFEFVTVMISMILALCLGQLLRSVSYLVKTERDVLSHPPYTIWFVVILLSVINHWWSLWDLKDVEWNYVRFLYILIAPIVLTFATGLFSPNRSGTDSIDLKAHFERIRLLFASAFMIYGMVMWFDGPLLAGQNVFGAVGLLHVPILAGTSLALFTRNYRANVIGPAMIITILLAIMAFRFASTP